MSKELSMTLHTKSNIDLKQAKAFIRQVFTDERSRREWADLDFASFILDEFKTTFEEVQAKARAYARQHKIKFRSVNREQLEMVGDRKLSWTDASITLVLSPTQKVRVIFSSNRAYEVRFANSAAAMKYL
jgi:replicative DNA helicase